METPNTVDVECGNAANRYPCEASSGSRPDPDLIHSVPPYFPEQRVRTDLDHIAGDHGRLAVSG